MGMATAHVQWLRRIKGSLTPDNRTVFRVEGLGLRVMEACFPGEWYFIWRGHGDLVQNITSESHALEIQRNEGARASQPEASFAAVERYAPLVQPPVAFPTRTNWIDLEWKPPNSSWAFHESGASFKDYCVLFSFWNKFTTVHYPGAAVCQNWTIALLTFMQAWGNLASFVHRCPNLGTIIWKFRNLSISMFSEAWPDEPDFDSFSFEQ